MDEMIQPQSVISCTSVDSMVKPACCLFMELSIHPQIGEVGSWIVLYE